MRVLLDTSCLLWALTGSSKADPIKEYLVDPRNEIYFSSVSIWEIMLKHAKKKLDVPPAEAYKNAIKQKYIELPVNAFHINEIGSLNKPGELDHNDPFDRILIAQAKYENLSFYTSDRKIAGYSEPCINYFQV